MKRFAAGLLLPLMVLALVAGAAFAQEEEEVETGTQAVVDDDDQEDEDYRWRRWRRERWQAHDFDGIMTIHFTYQTYDDNAMKSLAEAMGVELPGNGMLLWGMHFLGHVGDDWRIGGGFYTGHDRLTGVFHDADQEYNRQLKINFSGGGFIAEYTPVRIGPVSLAAGSLLGGGRCTIEMRQDTGAFDWDDLTIPYTNSPSAVGGENIVTRVTRPFWVARPYVTARVRLLEWMGVEGTAGWHLDSMSGSGWIFSNHEIIGDGPDIDFKQVYYRFSVILGG